MRALQLLGNEHTLIKSLIETLDAAARRLERGFAVDPDLLQQLMGAIARDLQDIHMIKEENVLFPYLHTHGMPRSNPVIEALSTQHETVKVYVRDLSRLAERHQLGDGAARAPFVVLTRDLIALVREHMRIEESYFYSLADQVVPADEDEMLMGRFQEVDRVGRASAVRDTCERILDRCREQFAVNATG
jgi:hemerythrin-like domain-containing protein